MIYPIKKLKIGLLTELAMIGIIAFLSFTQMTASATIPIDIVIILVGWISFAALIFQFLIIERLWKYHELCKECEIVKEMVKHENIR